jgi:hypothetical protein
VLTLWRIQPPRHEISSSRHRSSCSSMEKPSSSKCTGFFTRIRSGASLEASSGGVSGSLA